MRSEKRIHNPQSTIHNAFVVSSLLFRSSFVILISSFVISLCVGCGPVHRSPPPKPVLYRIQGQVIDARTGHAVAGARILLRAAIPVETGTQTISSVLTSYGITGADGRYDVELSEGFDVVRAATRIRLEAQAEGYLAETRDLPVPAVKEKVYRVTDLSLIPGRPPPAKNPRIPGVTP